VACDVRPQGGAHRVPEQAWTLFGDRCILADAARADRAAAQRSTQVCTRLGQRGEGGSSRPRRVHRPYRADVGKVVEIVGARPPASVLIREDWLTCSPKVTPEKSRPRESQVTVAPRPEGHWARRRIAAKVSNERTRVTSRVDRSGREG